MAQSRTRFRGLDVHKETMAVASVAQEPGAEVTDLGPMGTRQCAIDPLMRQMPSKATYLIFVYEAGPCGYGLSRSLTQKDDHCWGGAPSLMPKKAGDRVKTHRRDAMQLARLARAGDRTAVSGPKVAEEAMRDLTWAREETLSDCQDAQLRRKAVLLRHALRSTGQAHGGPAPLRGRSEGVCPPPAPPIVCHASVRAVPAPTERRQRLAQERHEPVPAWRVPAGVAALQARRGVPCPVAVTMVAALGALPRLATPRARRPCLGLIPAAYASGERRHQGAITPAGTPLPDGRSWQAPGPPALPPRCAAMGNGALHHHPR